VGVKISATVTVSLLGKFVSSIWARSVIGNLRSGPDPDSLIFLLSRIWAESGPGAFASVHDPGNIWS
jgi:hypothetical protein